MLRTLGLALVLWTAGAATYASEVMIVPPADVQGLAVSRDDPNKITISTSDGQWLLGPDGDAERAEGIPEQIAAQPALLTLPKGLNDMVSLGASADRVYAATDRGLMLSPDGGVSWVTVYAREIPVSAVEKAADGWIYAYVTGEGVVRSRDPSTAWRRMGDPATGAPLRHIAADPQDPRRLVAADAAGRFVVSTDNGRTWQSFVR